MCELTILTFIHNEKFGQVTHYFCSRPLRKVGQVTLIHKEKCGQVTRHFLPSSRKKNLDKYFPIFSPMYRLANLSLIPLRQVWASHSRFCCLPRRQRAHHFYFYLQWKVNISNSPFLLPRMGSPFLLSFAKKSSDK